MIRKLYTEEFFTMDSFDKYGEHKVYSIYRNPSMREYAQFIYPEARAFIDKLGNLYVEGDEDKDPKLQWSPSAVLHADFIKALATKITLPSRYADRYPFSYFGEESNYGIGVYADTPDTLRVSSLYLTAVDLHLDKNQAKILFDRCREKNPQITKLMISKSKVLFQ